MRAFLYAVALGLMAGSAGAAVINFDDQGLTGPKFFADTTPQDVNVTIGTIGVNITGGGILDNTAFLPGNNTAVYGTADFFPGGLNPIVVTFTETITNFFLDVFNGNTSPVSYLVSDNNGNSTTVTLPSNTDGGRATIAFAAVGTQVSIFALAPTTPSCCAFDFFIDNIHFNEPLPPSVPLPAGLPLLIGGVATLGFLRRKRAA